MATVEEVEKVLHDLVRRLQRIDPSYRAMLPSRRTIEARCPDLELTYHATWRSGRLSELQTGPAPGRPEIRVAVDSDDLLAMSRGELDFQRAFNEDRVKVRASMTDLLRLRAVL